MASEPITHEEIAQIVFALRTSSHADRERVIPTLNRLHQQATGEPLLIDTWIAQSGCAFCREF